ncbi:MAG: HAD family hydrolase [Anaerolineae bacterium]|nr:HAD family hydrolase [Anaerolineae bacterium]
MRAVIWDFDGTLGYRSGGAWTATLWEVLQSALPGCPITQEQLRPYMQSGFPWHEPDIVHTQIDSADVWWHTYEPVLTRAYQGVGFSGKDAKRYASRFRSTYLNLDRWRVYDDVVPVLDALSKAGWIHVLLSNHVPELREIVEHLGLVPHFTHILNSADTGYEKPHPCAFRAALAFLSGYQSVWMVGDNPVADVRGAMDMGMPAILVRRYHADVPFYVDSLHDVPPIIENNPPGIYLNLLKRGAQCMI